MTNQLLRKNAYPLSEAKNKKAHRKLTLGGRLVWNSVEKFTFIFLTGGVGYGLIELLWRGRTHPSMVLTGGACFTIIYGVNQAMKKRSVFLRSMLCAAAITAVEFSVGMVVNRLLQLGVWDYSGMKWNLLGQICPLYSFFWFLLCIPLMLLLSKISPKAAACEK